MGAGNPAGGLGDGAGAEPDVEPVTEPVAWPGSMAGVDGLGAMLWLLRVLVLVWPAEACLLSQSLRGSLDCVRSAIQLSSGSTGAVG